MINQVLPAAANSMGSDPGQSMERKGNLFASFSLFKSIYHIRMRQSDRCENYDERCNEITRNMQTKPNENENEFNDKKNEEKISRLANLLAHSSINFIRIPWATFRQRNTTSS